MVQPIVLIGGLLSFPTVYRGMRKTLGGLAGQPVWVVEVYIRDWMSATTPAGWKRLLDKLQHTVLRALGDSSTGKVTIVGHSAGGVVARLYLSPEPFLGVTYGGLEHVACLITLGSPHYSERGTRMRHWVEEACPDAYFAPQVGYTSVAGKAVQGRRDGSFRERFAYLFYRRLAGDGETPGDGLVPVRSALLRGSRQIALDGVSHFSGFGGPWYGAEEIMPLWWDACSDNARRGSDSVFRAGAKDASERRN
jgi:pimeloyl-ACP methyl ester carboxylesterase